MTNTIRAFALVCVATVSTFVMGMGIWLVWILSDRAWCSTAVGADKATGGRSETGVNGCVNLMGRQLDALSTQAFIYGGVIALCLLVLMVIVVAGGRLSFKASKDGAEADIGAAAQYVANEAQNAADEVKP